MSNRSVVSRVSHEVRPIKGMAVQTGDLVNLQVWNQVRNTVRDRVWNSVAEYVIHEIREQS